MPRSTAITSALINKLLADPVLMALTPDGVFKDVAGDSMATPAASGTRYVIVSLVLATNVLTFERRAYQEALYLIEARMLSTSHGDVNAAAAQIDAVLDPQPPAPSLTLTIPGFRVMALFQEEPTEHTEFDEADSSIEWRRAGGRYRIFTQPIAS